jgi:hypothetical protein
MLLDTAFWAVCLVLVAAGATKAVDPAPLAVAIRALWGRPSGEHSERSWGPAVQIIGGGEVAIGVTGLAWAGRPAAAAVAAAYLAFAVIVVRARSRHLPSCGCFGSRSGPPSLLQAGVNTVSALVAVAAIVAPPVPAADALGGSAGQRVAVAAAVVIAIVIIVVDTRAGGATVPAVPSSRGTDERP